MILQATHTHLYPGHRGKVAGLERIADLAPKVECLVEFSDGSAASARLSRSGNDWQLHTNAYRTGAGTDIPEKCWRVRLQGDGDGAVFRILNREA